MLCMLKRRVGNILKHDDKFFYLGRISQNERGFKNIGRIGINTIMVKSNPRDDNFLPSLGNSWKQN